MSGSAQQGSATEARPFADDLAAERHGWYELIGLPRGLTEEECLAPGYFRDPDWSIRDVVGHVGTWLAMAAVQLKQLAAGTYEGHDIDIDRLNAGFLEAMHGQPWSVCWVQANASRTQLLDAWSELPTASDEAAWWIRKSGAEHYAEHLPRLRDWIAELVARRAEGEAGSS